MNNEELKIIARTIGYHFWKPENDMRAEIIGMNCAIEIGNALEKIERQPNEIKSPNR